MKTPIYLDHHATTPVAPEAFEAMKPYFCEHFGNASSSTHSFGWKADLAVKKARSQVAQLIHSLPSEIYFTSGATESNNWALFGLLPQWVEESKNQPIHLITSNAEHSCNLAVFRKAKRYSNVTVTVLEVNSWGQISAEQVRSALRPETRLMSFIYGNNEIGSLNPIAEIGALAKERNIIFHSDAAQCLGKVAVDVTALNVDLVSMASHKMYGPKGVGALYIRSHDPKVSLQPLIEGGGQERGLRSGTLNVPGIVGMGVAAELSLNRLDQDREQLVSLSNYFLKEIRKAFPNVQLNGHPTEKLPNNLNLTFKDLDVDRLLPRISHIAVSTGSACASGSANSSHVLKAIGLTDQQTRSTIRFGLGRSTTQDQLNEVIHQISESRRVEASK